MSFPLACLGRVLLTSAGRLAGSAPVRRCSALHVLTSIRFVPSGATADTEIGLTSEPYPYHQLNIQPASTTFYPGLFMDFEITSKMSDGTPVDGSAFVRCPRPAILIACGYFSPAGLHVRACACWTAARWRSEGRCAL